ncbi:hypothetical protein [Priestia flexa]|uniref:hypothetical protein n=1 Tax=Priestia flexa TaxID=86664 RepID=UPI0004738DBD|nr:hypothetical protein [Priestia flexa]
MSCLECGCFTDKWICNKCEDKYIKLAENPKRKQVERRFKKGDLVFHKWLGFGELLNDGYSYLEGTVYSFNTRGNGVFPSDLFLVCAVEDRPSEEEKK